MAVDRPEPRRLEFDKAFPVLLCFRYCQSNFRYLPRRDAKRWETAVLKDYTTQLKAGKDPEFKAASIGLEGKTEFWS